TPTIAPAPVHTAPSRLSPGWQRCRPQCQKHQWAQDESPLAPQSLRPHLNPLRLVLSSVRLHVTTLPTESPTLKWLSNWRWLRQKQGYPPPLKLRCIRLLERSEALGRRLRSGLRVFAPEIKSLPPRPAKQLQRWR